MSGTSHAPSPGLLRRLGTLALVVALAATGGMVAYWGTASITAAVWRGMPALPAALAVHTTQLFLSGSGWWLVLPAPRPPLRLVARARWIREAVNTLLPLAGLSGGVASTRLLARRGGVSMALATASTTLDLTCEAASLAPFLIASLATVALLAPGELSAGRAALAILPVVAGAVGFVVAQRAGMLKLAERAAARLGFPGALDGLHESLMTLHARRGDVGRAILLQALAWSLGGAEVWAVLRAIGAELPPLACFAVEGLGMTARSLGFALPAGLAAQEAGFVIACGLFGVPAADAVALSMVKRVRELVVGAAGVLAWRLGR